MKRVLATWVVVWLVGGLLGGAALSMAEAGHLPRPLLPPLLGAAGALAGTIGGLLRSLLPVAIQETARHRVIVEILTGAAIGILIGIGSWWLGLGLPSAMALGFGAVLGAFSGLAVGVDAGRRAAPPPRRPTSTH